jgi:hypothetical protein
MRLSRKAHMVVQKRNHTAAALCVMAAVSVVIADIADARRAHAKKHTSRMTGQHWIDELLQSNNAFRFRDQFGLRREVFKRLVAELQKRVQLRSTRYVNVQERVAIFLYAVVTNISNRKLQERFQRSGDTISKFVSLLRGF